MTKIRDRIVEFRRVPASLLVRNERNWRTHPEHQRAAMKSVLRDIGYADALLARRLADGRLELIDGHLRAEVTPDEEVPVLIVDVNDEEARLLLAVHDTLPQLAGSDDEKLTELLRDVETADEAISKLFETVAGESTTALSLRLGDGGGEKLKIEPMYHVVVECEDEADQQAVYELMHESGRHCRVLTL
ncbi:MAG: hypothetical protein DWQ31_15635 [Planctomycetota bacterium]|nr:MAG: hypothetical protein DWQ31_15635 [Planctomycetota bacterium]REJ89970.1 MAG: hypothetical protein DWQ35_17280 [Planctomycetota bacterium]REK28203.1 MAG: hypothetical protein DWQ42_05665 [Planctomycetota bacterium]REK42461.1 MAG: hypothetical protein DWQ46_13305 [Planctomycetota bacterium]